MLVDGGGKYGVRLVNPSGTCEQTIEDMALALDHFQNIASALFSSLKTRVEEQRSQVEGLSCRLATASHSLRLIQDSQKAIPVLSPAKYPASPSQALGPISGPKLHPDNLQGSSTGRTKYSGPPIRHPNDLLSCFHVRDGGPFLGPIPYFLVGLGKPPRDLNSVHSFLLFNHAQNPYQHYRVSGKSLGAGGVQNRQVKRQVPTSEEPIAPTGGSTEVKEADDFYYSPSTLQIPDINVPEHLPHLPGIVDSLDISPLINQPFRIFPFQQSKGGSSPTSPWNKSEQVNSHSPLISNQSIPGTETIEAEIATQLAPTSRTPALESMKIWVAEEGASGAPPPPPPPPPPIHTPPQKHVVPVPSDAKKSGGPEAVVEDRSNLMAAIREAGGAGKAILKSAKDRKYEAKKKKQEEKERNSAVESSDGLMSDLKNTLAMRRKGISGSQGGGKERAGLGDIMQKLASTIPTIPSMEQSTNSKLFSEAGDSEDDDWD